MAAPSARAVSELEKNYGALDGKCGLTEHQIEDILMNNAKKLFAHDCIPIQIW